MNTVTIPGNQESTLFGRYTRQFLNQNKGRKERKNMTGKLRLPWLRYGRYLIIPVDRDSSLFWRQK